MNGNGIVHRLSWVGAGMAAGLVGAALLAQAVLARPGVSPAQASPGAASPATIPAVVADADAAIADWASPDALVPTAEAAVLDEALDIAEVDPPAPLRLASVPFRTQRDGSPYAGSNCGPAALGMVLESYGISQGTDDLRYLTHTYQGTWLRRGGTALQHMARVAEDFGLRAVGLYEGDSFRRWSVADVRAEVEQGHPVIALVKYRLLPGREYSPVRYDHYVVLWDVTADGFIYNDPIYPAADEGYARFITNAQLDAAMAPAMEPRQAVAFS